MDKKPVILTTLRHYLRRLQTLERSHCDDGTAPIADFPCRCPSSTRPVTSSASSCAGARLCRSPVHGAAAEPQARCPIGVS
jgi:hypothetical protein